MTLPLCTGGVLLVVLAWELIRVRSKDAASRAWGSLSRWARGVSRVGAPSAGELYDPGRERRAEQRARALLRSCVSELDWAMYRDLGFLRVWGGGTGGTHERASYAYLIYPHKPIVAYVPQTGELLNEYCVTFPDQTRPYGSARLPNSDDVLAKWMAITADERRLIGEANMHLPGRQLDPERVRRDLARMERWERGRPAREPDGVRVA